MPADHVAAVLADAKALRLLDRHDQSKGDAREHFRAFQALEAHLTRMGLPLDQERWQILERVRKGRTRYKQAA